VPKENRSLSPRDLTLTVPACHSAYGVKARDGRLAAALVDSFNGVLADRFGVASWHAKAPLVAAGGIAGEILATLAGMPRAGPGRRVGPVAAGHGGST
jgi:hypothetical protein